MMLSTLKNNIRFAFNGLLLFGLVFAPLSSPTGTPKVTSFSATTGPALSVDAAASQHAISPYIYGLNFAKESFANEIKLPVRRWGGNATTRYNWQTGNTNAGNDWYYENMTSPTHIRMRTRPIPNG